MSGVFRFTLPTARNLEISGVGPFINGVLDVDANNLARVSRARYLTRPYGAVEVGLVNSDTPPPTLPAAPGPPNPDPYPQYLTDEDAASQVILGTGTFGAATWDTFAHLDGGVLMVGDTLVSGGGGSGTATDAQLRDRSTHTGTQAISTVTGLQTALNATAPLTGVEGVKVHDGTAGGGVRPTGFARVRWINPAGTTYARPTNMVTGDIWEHDA